MRGRGDMGTLVSTRLQKYYGKIVQDLDKTMAAYDFMRQVNKTTEDGVGGEYFFLLQQTFEALNDETLPLPLVSFWFGCQMLRLGGHTPNLSSDEGGHKLDADMQYNFSFDTVNFVAAPGTGRFGVDEIKFLRLAFTEHPAKLLAMVQGSGRLVRDLLPLVESVQRAIL
jgi:recombinational DNA repair protein (RecF pathway)